MIIGTLQIVLVSSAVVSAGKDVPVTFRFRRDGRVSMPLPQAEPPDGAMGAG